MTLLELSIAIFGGFFAGFINTLAGNGSAITLTILTEVFGLPGNIANGTNRIGVLAQGVFGSYIFHKNGKLKPERSIIILSTTIGGAIVGVITAVYASNEQFLNVFRFMMVAMLFVIIVKPKRWLKEPEDLGQLNRWITIPLFTVIGFYGGFIQMGMGIFFLAALVLVAKYSIIDSNAIKTFVVTAYTVLVVIIFQVRGLIVWEIGLTLAIGQAIGGWISATFASKHPKANVWAYRVLIFAVLLSIAAIFEII